MSSNTTQDAVLEAARTLIERGRKVFPISSEKIPYPNCADCKGKSDADHREVCECLTNGNRCHGFYSATSNIEIVRSWLDETPDMDIAVATGKPSGIFVFEYDPKNGGDVSYSELISQHGAIQTETNMSPGGGLHHIFLMPNFDFGSIHGKIWPGIDIKATGGYALFPPSTTDKGQYVNVQNIPAAPAPNWLKQAIFDYQSKNRWSDARTLRKVEAKEFDPESLSDEMSERVRKTIEYWTNRVRTAPDGSQNILLYTGARVLFSLAVHGLLAEDTAQSVLEEAAEDGNHPTHRAMLAIDSGRRAADADPDPYDDALSNDLNIVETFKQDDIGNANRVVFWKGNDIRYDPDRERFYTWAETKWVPAREGRVWNIVEDVITKITITEAPFYSNLNFPPSQANKTSPKTYRELFCTWAQTQRFANRISGTTAVMKGRKQLWCESDDFDPDPYHFNVANGIIDLKTGNLMEHDRSHMCMHISDVLYDPDAKAPNFERFLDLTQPNREHRAYLQRLVGYSLLGLVRDQIFVVHIGSGGNGKGVFLDIVSYVLGEYSTTGQRDSFVRKSNSNRIPADIASMEGKRFVVVDELNDNQKMDEALLKDITGGGKIKAESKNVNPWEYTPKFTLHFRTNHMPDLPSDKSIVRRFRPVKWTVEPTSEQWDSFLTSRFSNVTDFLTKQESSGILNWILEGTMDYLKYGLQEPDDLKLEAVDMLQDNDPFLIFMKENTSVAEGVKLEGTRVYKAYHEWHKTHGFAGNPRSSRDIYKDVKDGKYKDKFKWEMHRERFHFLDIQLDNLLSRA